MRPLHRILFLALVLPLAACAARNSTPLMDSATVAPPDPRPSEGRALVVFARSGSAVASVWTVAIADVTDSGPTPIGVLAAGMSTAYEVEPGPRTFLATVAGSGRMLEANLAADRTYFVYLRPGGFRLEPLRSTRPKGWPDFRHSSLNAAGREWFVGNLASFEGHATELRASWADLDDEERAARTLEAEDGLP